MEQFCLQKNKRVYNCSAFANKLVDKVGAGDTMLALISILLKVRTKRISFINRIICWCIFCRNNG